MQVGASYKLIRCLLEGCECFLLVVSSEIHLGWCSLWLVLINQGVVTSF